MLEKNIEKRKRANRPNQWRGLAPKVEPTKRERLEKKRKKYKKSLDN